MPGASIIVGETCPARDVVPGFPAVVASPDRSIALPKKPNYDFEKRRKELDRKKKKDAKREERLQRGRDENPDDQSEPAQQTSQDDLAGPVDRY